MPVAIAGAVASMLAPAIARLIGARAVLAGGLGLAAIGMLYLGVAGSDLNLAGVLVSTSLIGAGTGSLAIGSAMIMAGSPVEKAGNAGALEETSYEFGATLGVAILGSIAALIYRFQLAVDPAMRGIDSELLTGAKESLGAAFVISEQAGMPELIESASAAFARSLQAAGYAGGFFMLAVAVLVFFLTPKGTDVEGAEH
jgi:DHA2 family multidrug resistance protein-like MFS transporter